VTAPFDAPAAVRYLRKADPALAGVIRRAGPCELAPRLRHSPFEELLEAIVYQQLSGKAAATIYGRVRGLFPARRALVPQALLDAPEEALRGAGLSRAKLAAARDLAAKTLEGVVPTAAALRRMPDEEIIQRLTVVRGVGTWTVQMLLIFRLGRPDVLPIHDLGIQKGFQRTFETRQWPKPGRIERHGERWRPFRSVAAWYLWRATDQAP
jgi:3-methyladenine DNA glycosylase/8-oxoguanine DNA glycosylase